MKIGDKLRVFRGDTSTIRPFTGIVDDIKPDTRISDPEWVFLQINVFDGDRMRHIMLPQHLVAEATNGTTIIM